MMKKGKVINKKRKGIRRDQPKKKARKKNQILSTQKCLILLFLGIVTKKVE